MKSRLLGSVVSGFGDEARNDRLALVGQFLAPSTVVSELVWWPCRCFSQAWAMRPKRTTVAIRVAVIKRCMAKNSDEISLGAAGKLGPRIAGFGLDFVTIGSRCGRLLASDPLQMQQLPLFRRPIPGRGLGYCRHWSTVPSSDWSLPNRCPSWSAQPVKVRS